MAERIIELDAGTYDIRGDGMSQITVPLLTAGTIDDSSPDIGATLTVSGSNASGGPATAYQWQQSANGSTWGDIFGATGASLDTSSGVTAGYHVRRGVSDGVQGPIYTVAVQMAVPTATLSGASAANDAGNIDWGVTTDEASGTIYAALRLSSGPQLTASDIINGAGGAIDTATDATPTADGNNGGTFLAPGSGSYAVDIVQVTSGNSNVVSSGTVVVGENTAELTISDFDEANDTLDLTSSKVGTCHFGIYPGGTAAGDITIAAMIAGTDTGLIDNGTAGVFVTAGILDDVVIDDSALTEGSQYVIAFVVDIGDGGTYTNLALQTFGAAKTTVATTIAEDTFTAANGTNLAGRSADLGGAWVLNDGSKTSSNVDINGNALRFGGTGGARYYYMTTPNAENVEVRADIGYATGMGGIGLLARVTGDGATFGCYFGRVSYPTRTCELYRFSNGAATLIGTSGPLGLGTSGAARLVLRCNGTTIEMDWNGGTVISVTDSDVTGPGTVGLGHYRGNPGTMDTFSAVSS